MAGFGEGLPIKPLDQGGIELIEPLIHVGDERLRDANTGWNKSKKRGGQGINHGVGKVRPALVATNTIHLLTAL